MFRNLNLVQEFLFLFNALDTKVDPAQSHVPIKILKEDVFSIFTSLVRENFFTAAGIESFEKKLSNLLNETTQKIQNIANQDVEALINDFNFKLSEIKHEIHDLHIKNANVLERKIPFEQSSARTLFIKISSDILEYLNDFKKLQSLLDNTKTEDFDTLNAKKKQIDELYDRLSKHEDLIKSQEKSQTHLVNIANLMLGIDEAYRGSMYESYITSQEELKAQFNKNAQELSKFPTLKTLMDAAKNNFDAHLQLKKQQSEEAAALIESQNRERETQNRIREDKEKENIALLEKKYNHALEIWDEMRLAKDQVKQATTLFTKTVSVSPSNPLTKEMLDNQVDTIELYSTAGLSLATSLSTLIDEIDTLKADISKRSEISKTTYPTKHLKKNVSAYVEEMNDCHNNLTSIIEVNNKIKASQLARKKSVSSPIIKDLLVFLKDLFSDENIIKVWHQQVSYAGRVKAWMDGAKVNVIDHNGTSNSLATPRGIYHGRNWLDKVNALGEPKNKTQADEKMILLSFVQELELRVRNDSSKRGKITNIVYRILIDELLDENKNQLKPLTNETLNSLIRQINDENINGLKLNTKNVKAAAATATATR